MARKASVLSPLEETDMAGIIVRPEGHCLVGPSTRALKSVHVEAHEHETYETPQKDVAEYRSPHRIVHGRMVGKEDSFPACCELLDGLQTYMIVIDGVAICPAQKRWTVLWTAVFHRGCEGIVVILKAMFSPFPEIAKRLSEYSKR